MKINEITIKNFRNYDELNVIFEKGINYLFGVNGVGKTNLIEAIYYLSNLSSFRTNDDKNLIKDLEKYFSIEATIDDKKYNLNITKDKKMLIVDGINYPKYRDYIGKVNVVEFCPEEVYLLKDFPKDRRKFIDKEISKIDNVYLNDMLVYNKLLKQRNELLRSEDLYSDKLFQVIDEKISEIQVSVIGKRKLFLKEIENIVNEFNTSLNKLYEFKIIYECSFASVNKEDIINEYVKNKNKDKEKMSTCLGVHRDDFKICINGKNACDFGSQGEQRFIVLLVKLALVCLVKNRMKKCPIVVLDDVFSELDANRRNEVYEILKNFEQVFITGCNKEDIRDCVSYEIKERHVFKIEGV